MSSKKLPLSIMIMVTQGERQTNSFNKHFRSRITSLARSGVIEQPDAFSHSTIYGSEGDLSSVHLATIIFLKITVPFTIHEIPESVCHLPPDEDEPRQVVEQVVYRDLHVLCRAPCPHSFEIAMLDQRSLDVPFSPAIIFHGAREVQVLRSVHRVTCKHDEARHVQSP